MILTKETLSAGPSIGTGEGVAHSKRWYVALVRMHHEKKVAERLDKIGIENFVPVQQEVHQWSDRRKVVESVLLPMMVFVHADPKERKEVLSFSTIYHNQFSYKPCQGTFNDTHFFTTCQRSTIHTDCLFGIVKHKTETSHLFIRNDSRTALTTHYHIPTNCRKGKNLFTFFGISVYKNHHRKQ